ncbi:zinc ABC transporter substrate-binding protein [Pseudanabaena sp. FACHB-2040]|uniref:metal ABC transporter solute-binding protein, Zn/Mn family n=1 Tax=Pseudanabaena sp. FACHB-2040 TaxID=2692859 RepID=UPI001687781C|nr:zinc ABC transporter substrate-binding protein [Pseudanabaena sp. FACHB-2040]MBD2260727.1 zinc ABC transporter substrate-binding protein [Pseudanabaena sp. FACHB-2040]
MLKNALRRQLWLGTAAALALGISSCDTPGAGPAPTDELQVVATSTILADLTAQVGGDAIQLTSLLNPGDDPHVYEPVPQDTVAIEEANLIFYNGYNLEPGLIRLIAGAGAEERAVAVGEVVDPLDFEYQGQIEPDPHVWGDVANAIAMTNAIRDALIELSPENESLFTENARQLTEQLATLDSWVAEQIATIPADQRQLVTTHDAFQYYANAYGLTVAGTLIGISTEEQPSAQTVSQLVQAIRAVGVPTIFAETTINPALIQTVAEEAGINLADDELYSDSIGAPNSNGDSYINMIAANTCAIATALDGTCTPFEQGDP